MSGLISILFLVFLAAFFYSIGLPFRRMLKGFAWEKSMIVTSSCGLAFGTLAVTLGYKFGLRPQLMFWILIAWGFSGLVNAYVHRQYPIGQISRRSRWYALIGMATAGLMLAPALLEGPQFTLFQGNHIDAMRYLESAITYTQWPYEQVHGATTKQLVEAGLFPFAAQNLNSRPAVAIIYAVLANFAPSLFLGLNYVMLIYFQFLSIGILWLLARELVSEKPWPTLLLSVLIVGGFWGQYILDINAWSQEAALPLLLTAMLMLVRFFSREQLITGLTYRSPILFVLCLMGAFYFYPEATIFYLPGFAVALGAGFWMTKKCVKVGPLITAMAITLVLVLAVKENNLDFLRGQAGVAINDLDWWRYFDLCFLGRDGISSNPVADLIDAGTTGLGGYLITPSTHLRTTLAVLWRGALAGILVLVMINFLRRFKHLVSPVREMLGGAVALLIVQTVFLLCLHKYWTAGKALSFFAYLLLLMVFAPLVTAGWHGRLWRDWTAAACSVLLSAQGWMLFQRPFAVKKHPYDHYSQPYPAALDRILKKRFDFSDWTVLEEIGAQDKVRIEVEDPWLQYFAQMLLLSHHRRFCVATPVDEAGVPVVASPCAGDFADFTCRLSLVVRFRPAVKEYLKIERLPAG